MSAFDSESILTKAALAAALPEDPPSEEQPQRVHPPPEPRNMRWRREAEEQQARRAAKAARRLTEWEAANLRDEIYAALAEQRQFILDVVAGFGAELRGQI